MEKETTEVPALKEQNETEVEEEESDEQEEESVEELKRRLTKAEELAQNQKLRAEKAERKAKGSTEIKEGLSDTDILFLAKTNIHDDDVSDVIRWAKNDGISVKEAYAQFKPILDTRTEERTSASVTHTKGGARGTNKVSGEDLLRKAERTGEVPDTDEGMMALATARRLAGPQ